MKPLAAVPSSMRRSGIRELMDLAGQVPDAIHLEVGQPDFPTPAHVVDAARRAAEQGLTGYTPNPGYLSLREAIAERVAGRDRCTVAVESVTVSPGAVCAIAMTLMALVDPGEVVLIPDPGWPNYEMAVRTIQGIPVRYPLDPADGFLPDLRALSSLATSNTKVLIINSPCNPTGAVFPAGTVESLVQFAAERDVYLISDEVYEDIVFEAGHISPLRFDPVGRVIKVSGFSKTYAMTGWRVGYAVAPVSISQVIAKLQEPYVSCACSVSQKAAEAALKGPQDCVATMRESYRSRRDLVMGILKRHGLFVYESQGAFYTLVDISKASPDSYAFAKELLLDRKVAVAPGAAFGDVGASYIRISFATDESLLVEGVERTCKYILSRTANPGC